MPWCDVVWLSSALLYPLFPETRARTRLFPRGRGSFLTATTYALSLVFRTGTAGPQQEAGTWIHQWILAFGRQLAVWTVWRPWPSSRKGMLTAIANPRSLGQRRDHAVVSRSYGKAGQTVPTVTGAVEELTTEHREGLSRREATGPPGSSPGDGEQTYAPGCAPGLRADTRVDDGKARESGIDPHLEQAARDRTSGGVDGDIEKAIRVEIVCIEAQIDNLLAYARDGAITSEQLRDEDFRLLDGKTELEAKLRRLKTQRVAPGEIVEDRQVAGKP